MAATSTPSGGARLDPSTLVEVLRSRAAREGGSVAFTFLRDGEGEEQQLTYAELDREARAIAAVIQSTAAPGERVLLLHPPGLHFISAFFGCLYAGVVAVPAYPPDPTRLERTVPRLQAVAADAQVTTVLTTREMMGMMGVLGEQAPSLESVKWIASDAVQDSASHMWREPVRSPEALAYLQYTSGSTAAPRGAMVSHANVLANLALIRAGFEHTRESRAVIWLPPYHDMGLVGGLLQPLYVGFPVILLSPVSFLQRPLRWLQAISRYRARVSGGPNFAYELCVRKISPQARTALDLSTWELAFCGAEPVRAETLARFVEAFAPCGFRRTAFYPCYGLAEATLIVSGGLKKAAPVVRNVDREALEKGQAVDAPAGAIGARAVVGCGRALERESIRIVDPHSLSPCPPGKVGEIWVSGPSVTQGYWNRPEDTERIFQARLEGTVGAWFLRTGDVGFLLDEELFITGRLKDLIIIRGRNLSPPDIELTAERSHGALRPGCGAAFSIEAGAEERLVVAHELGASGEYELDVVAAAIRQEVTEVHGVEVHSVVLIEPRSIPKTSSGKVQRHACKAAYMEGRLAVLHESRPAAPGPKIDHHNMESRSDTTFLFNHLPTVESIQGWLLSWLARELGVHIQDIDIRQPFSRYGLASAGAASLCGDLEDFLGRRLSPTLLYEHPTIEALSSHLVGGCEAARLPAGIRVDPRAALEPIAITGIGCRFPGADGPEAFWQLLREGRDAITEMPGARRELSCLHDADPGAPLEVNPRWGGFLERVDDFDARFFGISPREAARIDPQQRLLLEVAWEALEDAGLPPDDLAGTRTGVFIGISTNDYGSLQLGDPSAIDVYAVTGNASSIAANRLSYVLDLRGPSMAVDTACSSSLVAVHLACQSLWSGESSLALAGGVNVILSPVISMSFTKAGIIAPDGRCKAFDARANGYVRGEGVGVVVLKPLPSAVADGDPIYAVIRGSAVNQDGRTNGMLAPSPQAQAAVLHDAYRRANVSPGEVQYVEAHGTGTFLGDPMEAEALARVLSVGRGTGRRCSVGSVKTNIGHLEAAAGIAGLIKVALSLEHRAIPPIVHFREPNPHIAFDALPLRIQERLEPWPEGPRPALAGVSSFGFGGTNAHVVLQQKPMSLSREREAERGDEQAPSGGREGASGYDEAASRDEDANACQVHLLPLSGRSPEALRALANRYQERLAGDVPEAAISLHDFCYTASTRRSHHEHRLAMLARSREETVELLGAFVNGETRSGTFTGGTLPGGRRKTVFIFPGQGPKWWPLARALLEGERVFRSALEQCDRVLLRRADWSLLEQLSADEASCRMAEADRTQPAFLALQVALAALWRSWGISPDAVVGQSLGEVAAAHVAGALDLEAAVSVALHRGQLLKQVAGQGGMALVELPVTQVRQALARYESRLSVAAINGPTSTVISGEPTPLKEVLESLRTRGIFCHPLESVSFASHSPQMEPLRRELVQRLAGVKPSAGSVPIVSTVTGRQCDGRDFDGTYWARNLREPVLFSAAVERLVKGGHEVFLEMSPHPVLTGAVSQCLRHCGREGTVLASLRRGEEAREVMLASLARLYVLGHPVDWRKLYPGAGRCVQLPAYPWQREHYWLDARDTQAGANSYSASLRYSAGSRASSWKTVAWERRCQRQHRVRGRHAGVAQVEQDAGRARAPEAFTDWLYEPRWEPAGQPEVHLVAGDVSSLSYHPVCEQGIWLVFADGGGLAAALETLLAARGETCVLALPAGRYERAHAGRYLLDPASPRDFERLIADVFPDDARACCGVVHMWSLEVAPPAVTTLASLDAALDLGCTSVLHLVQAMVRAKWRHVPRLWLVTQGAQAVAGESEISVAQSPLWGLGRVVSQEHPELRCTRLDLDPDGTSAQAGAVFRELMAVDEEDEIALRHDRRYVHRLVRYLHGAAPRESFFEPDH